MALQIMSRADVAALAVSGVGQAKSIIDWVYYDTQSIANAQTAVSFSFFAEAVGGTVTLGTTNMELAGQIQAGYEFIVQQITAEAETAAAISSPNVVNDKLLVLQGNPMDARLTFAIGNRPFYQEKLFAFAGGGLHGFAALFQTANFYYASARVAQNGKLEYMPKIDGNTNFQVTVAYDAAPSPASTTKLLIKLRGKIIRPNSA